jgi:stage II sporulation protein D
LQQVKGHILSSLVVISLTLAALSAPPSVFAETTPPPAPSESTTPAPTTPAPQLPAVPAPVAGAIRIGLSKGLTAAEVTAAGGIYVIGDGVMQAQLPPGEPAKVTLDAGKVRVGAIAAKFDTVRLVPVAPAPTATAPGTTPVLTPGLPAPTATVPPKPANPITFKGKTYRGEILVVVAPASGQLSVVNVVNLDEYLLGVVPEEVGYEWPIEAIKAQAVAARTYALGNLGKRKADGYDLVSDTGDQFYGGIASERLQTSQAVVATRGQVLTYGGKIISAMYHSSSGGHTENVENIYYGLPVPYLKAVKDFDDVPANKNYSWTYRYTVAEFSQILANGGFGVGTVSSVTATGATYDGGRPRQFVITGAAGTQTVTGSQLRNNLTLPGGSRATLLSNPRSITVEPGGLTPTVQSYTETQPVAVLGAGGVVQQRTAGGSAILSAGKTPGQADGTVTAMGAKANQAAGIIVSGGGHGHAVGMSQYGAYGMALLGKSYTEILSHYYTGTKLETRQIE